MPFRPFDPTRRCFLERSAKAAALVTLTASGGGSARAADKAAKSDFMYQDHPHDGKSCGQCKFFSPEGPDLHNGSCSIVAGTISREGWCTAFAPKG